VPAVVFRVQRMHGRVHTLSSLLVDLQDLLKSLLRQSGGYTIGKKVRCEMALAVR
jgi:hypothetical protein